MTAENANITFSFEYTVEFFLFLNMIFFLLNIFLDIKTFEH
jgi:hypothetical protein